jgi:menaquinone reductase, multiheme cytochrome c subunit
VMKHWLPFLVGFVFTLALGWVVLPELLYRTEPQPLDFNHKVHTGDQGGMACDVCHTFTDDGRFEGIPAVAKCAECHSSPIGDSHNEKALVDEFITPNKQIPWLVYARQPDNAYFSHAVHTKLAGLACEQCHGQHGASEKLAKYQVDRISGYSRDITGRTMLASASDPSKKMTMDSCVRCHANHSNRTGCIECHK